jgi:hypothetical protein
MSGEAGARWRFITLRTARPPRRRASSVTQSDKTMSQAFVVENMIAADGAGRR